MMPPIFALLITALILVCAYNLYIAWHDRRRIRKEAAARCIMVMELLAQHPDLCTGGKSIVWREAQKLRREFGLVDREPKP